MESHVSKPAKTWSTRPLDDYLNSEDPKSDRAAESHPERTVRA